MSTSTLDRDRKWFLDTFAKASQLESRLIPDILGAKEGSVVKAVFPVSLDLPDDVLRTAFGLTLSVPIFNGFQTRNQVRAAELSRKNQMLQLENTRKTLYKEIQQAYYNAVAAREKLLSSKEAEASAKESYDLVTAKYENGKANITEFNEARDAFLRSESDLSRARYEFLYATKLLDFYQGRELDF